MDKPKHALKKTHSFLKERESLDLEAYNCPQDHIHGFLKELRDAHEMDLLADVTAIDHFEGNPRFEVVYHLYSTERHVYLRVATPCGGKTDPVCRSVTDLWPAADWHEREAYDMFGIRFEGHPDLRRILMWDGYPYHPLRKEFPLAGEEVAFPSEDLTEATGTSLKPAPMMGGPFHSAQKGPMSKREPRADDESWTEVRERDDRPDGGLPERPRDLKEQD